MPFVPLVAMGSLVFTLINLLRNASNKLWAPVTTQLSAWVAGVVAVALVAQTNYAEAVRFGTLTLAQLNGASLVFVGLSAASLFGVVTDLKKAVDNTDTASKPSLF